MGFFSIYSLLMAILVLGILDLIWAILCYRYTSNIIERDNRYKLFNRIFWKLFVKEDERLDLLLKEVMLKSRSCGFPELFISIYRVSFFIPTDFQAEIHQNNLRAEIFVSRLGTFGFGDKKLRSVIAHEIGHYIDYKTNRQGHPVLDRVRKLELDQEEFAWFIAMYLYPDTLEFYPGLDIEYPKLRNLEFTSQHTVKSVE